MLKPLSGLRLLLKTRVNLVILIQISMESTLQTPVPLRPRLVIESTSSMDLLSLAVHLRPCHSLSQRPSVVLQIRPKRHPQLHPATFVVLRQPKRYQLATVLQLHSNIPRPATFVVLRLPKTYQPVTVLQLHSSILCQLKSLIII